jgi:uncharacterized protein YcbK (DUF882 family)
VNRTLPTLHSRRAFLGLTALTTAIALAGVSRRAQASGERRTLSFKHTHTGESLSAEYFVDGVYQIDVLDSIDHFLRDFRTGDTHAMDPDLLDLIHELALQTGVDAPYEVISAYRSPATNAMLHETTSGVSEHSQHMLGKAIDVRLPGFPTERLAEMARMMARGGVGYYPDSNFVHIDTGPVRSW